MPSPKPVFITSMFLFMGIVGLISANEIATTSSLSTQAPRSSSTQQSLESIRTKYDAPALAAAFVKDGKLVDAETIGYRKAGGTEKVLADDKFHIGSITKSMTASLAGMLVEKGKISWTTTIGESFPELQGQIHPQYTSVTLEQLLAHRGGAPGDPPPDLWHKAWEAEGTPAEQRMEFVKGLLARKPEAKPGTKYIYSNQGYAIAGVMLANASGTSWETMMESMLFDPLGMTSAGFGAPATPGTVDQPWGHEAGFFGQKPVPPGPAADNPLAISPAGGVHCSIADLAKYAAFHLAGARGDGTLLKPETFRKLHTVVGDDYALGWTVNKRNWAGGAALSHAGSNTTFFAVVWIAPERNCAIIAATNAGGDNAFKACDAAIASLLRKHGLLPPAL